MKSFLFVPAKEKFLKSINKTNADAIILDLEDSILEDDKKCALNLLIEAIPNIKINNKFVRINIENAENELRKLYDSDISGFMIPKVEDSVFFEKYSSYLKNKINIALIETPKGLINLQQVCQSEFVQILALGAEDYTCYMNMENSFENLLLARSKIVLYGKAFKKRVIDTPSFNFKNLSELEREIKQIKGMGFDGKLSIHPAQLEVINRVFKNTDFVTMKQIVETYEKGNESVVEIGGVIYEKPHIQRLKRILKENE